MPGKHSRCMTHCFLFKFNESVAAANLVLQQQQQQQQKVNKKAINGQVSCSETFCHLLFCLNIAISAIEKKMKSTNTPFLSLLLPEL